MILECPRLGWAGLGVANAVHEAVGRTLLVEAIAIGLEAIATRNKEAFCPSKEWTTSNLAFRNVCVHELRQVNKLSNPVSLSTPHWGQAHHTSPY